MIVAMLLGWCLVTMPVIAEDYYDLEINDGHIHYNDDIWSRLSPEHALRALTRNNINRAIVFSTPTEGVEKIYPLAPDRIIPFITPYRTFRERFTYHSDPSLIPFLEEKIALGIYRGIGEFHLFKKHKDTEVVKQMMQLAADHELAIHAHADHPTILTLLELQPGVRVIWSHCGMEHPVEDVIIALEKYPNLFCELSFRYQMFDDNLKLRPIWKNLLETQAERFIVGMDTWVPRRWASLPEDILFAREWLMQLPEPARTKIARENIDNWF